MEEPDMQKESSSEEEAGFTNIKSQILKMSYMKFPKQISNQTLKERIDWIDLKSIIKFEIDKIDNANRAIL